MTNNLRIAKVQQTLRRLEDDMPLLNMRVRELSTEQQALTKKFASAMIDQTRAELERLLQEQPVEEHHDGPPCEPAD